MRTLKAIQKAAVVLGGLALILQARADTVAFQNPVGLATSHPNGVQPPAGTTGGVGAAGPGPFTLSLEFTVNQNITITALGAYDVNVGGSGTGLASPVQVGIWSEDNFALVGSVATISGTQGTVIDSSRFVAITPLTLTPGTYQVIASNYGGDGTAPNWNFFYDGNESGQTEANPLVFNDSGGAITVGGSFYEPTGGFGTPADPDFQQDTYNQQYAAGTFTYTTVPEPSVVEVSLLGGVLLGAVAWRRKLVRRSA
jgi:PEP-CTERM motif-containing protein